MIVEYFLDPAASRFTVQAFAGGMLSVFAHNPTFAIRDIQGGMQFDDATFAEAAFVLTVKADSLELIDNVKPADREEIKNRMRHEVLESAHYPEISYGSTDIAADSLSDNWRCIRLRGTLSLHGVSRPHQVEVRLRALAGEIRLSGISALTLSAFQLTRVSALGGMIRLKDELKFVFDLVARKGK